MGRRRQFVGAAFGLCVAALAVLLASPSNPVGYLARAAVGQAAMLTGRVEAERAIHKGWVTPRQAEQLRRVPRIMDWAAAHIGLAATDNYATINPTWDRTIWNVSACGALSFEPKRYWFPIVGSLTYIGYFDEALARDQERRLAAQGFDVWVRTAGAYSTLGWFRDPILPEMLDWDEDRLSETLIHELAHATLWIPGHPGFNEAFANFVGEAGAVRWLREAYGPTHPLVTNARLRDRDDARARRVLTQVWDELSEVYNDQRASDVDRLKAKAAILGTLPSRASGAGFEDPDRYPDLLAHPRSWNNARLLQFTTYQRGQDTFAALLAQQGGDLRTTVDVLRTAMADTDDPWARLSELLQD